MTKVILSGVFADLNRNSEVREWLQNIEDNLSEVPKQLSECAEISIDICQTHVESYYA